MVELREPRMQARQGASEQEHAPAERDRGGIELGTVGWDDADETVEPGTTQNDGVTLVRVTLYSGRDPNSQHDPTRAQGTKILARNSAGEVVPAGGSQVLVARPAGMDGPGLWHIISNPGAGFGPVRFADGGTFISRGLDGTVSIGTTTDGTETGKITYLQVRRDGLRYVAPWGKITFDQGGLHVLHFSGARLDLGGIGGLPSPLDTLGTYATLGAQVIKVLGSAVSIGPDAGGVPDTAAKSTVLLALLGNIATMLGEISIALTNAPAAFLPNPTPPGPASLTALTAAAAALATNFAAFSTAVTAAAATLPSQSTGVT